MLWSRSLGCVRLREGSQGYELKVAENTEVGSVRYPGYPLIMRAPLAKGLGICAGEGAGQMTCKLRGYDFWYTVERSMLMLFRQSGKQVTFSSSKRLLHRFL